MTTYIAAISGGVDSVALLHMLSKTVGHKVVVAHFDHGIRDDSREDAKLVAALADKYGFLFETKREELGRQASEERARDRRYTFLRELVDKHNGKIVTAHHGDDAVESIAINLHRGTGWRGVAVLDADVLRPLLHVTKQEILDYALAHQLEWREDSTNSSDDYLRNRLRKTTKKLSPALKKQLLVLRNEQIKTKKMIIEAVESLVGDGPEYSRYFFTHIPTQVAVECLRHITKAKLTRPQLERALLAIKTAAPKSHYTAGSGVTMDFTTRNFSLSLLK